MRSSVDLPQPDGPTTTTNSPSAISALTPWITWLAFLPLLYCLMTLRNDGGHVLVIQFLALDVRFATSRRRRQGLDEPFLHQDDDEAGGSMAKWRWP